MVSRIGAAHRGRGVAQTVATFPARRRPRAQWVLAQTHRRDHTRDLPPALRNLVLRRWGRNIFTPLPHMPTFAGDEGCLLLPGGTGHHGAEDHMPGS